MCCGRVNRGLAILGDSLFMGTIDGHLVAVNAKSGRLIWDAALARPEAGYSLTLAPLVVKDKVIVGPAGGEYGIRGFLAAFDAKTGKEVWRFNTIAGPGEPGRETWGGDSWKTGGGSIWVTGSYDPESNLTYWGVGNAGPDRNGDSRPGDNLYTASVVALDADTGKLKWHYQFSPHDEFDQDATQIAVLADIRWEGRPRKAMLWANRNGFFYVLDRTTGQFLSGKPFVRVTWAEGLRRERPSESRARAGGHSGGHARVSRESGRDQLVQPVVQPADRAVLRPGLGELRVHVHQAAAEPTSKGSTSGAEKDARPTRKVCEPPPTISGPKRRATAPSSRSIR